MMGTTTQKPHSGKGIFLYVVFDKNDRNIGSVCTPTGQVRWGPDVNVEFSYPVQGVAKEETVFQETKDGIRLIYREGMTGFITVRSNKLNISDMLALGMVQGQPGQQWIRLTPEMHGRFEYRGVQISFRFGPPPEAPAKQRVAKISRKYNRSLFPREDWPFVVLSILIYTMVFMFAAHLKTVPIETDPSNKPMPKRIAKLIYEAPQALTRARKEILKKKQEEKLAAEEAKKKKEEEEKPKEEKPKEEKPEPKPEPEKPKEPEKQAEQTKEPDVAKTKPEPAPKVETEAERRAKVRKKVAKKGLLGLLGGKGSAATSKAKGSIFKGTSAAADLDRVIENVQGLKTGNPNGEEDGEEVEIAEISTGIDEAAMEVASIERTVAIEKREDEEVEVAEEVEMDDLSFKEAVSAVHRIVGTYIGQLRYLYNRELRKNPDLEGKLTVSMTISPEGMVTDCSVTESTMGDPGFEKAVLARIRKWKFELAISKALTVEYPFVFFPSM